ncbi:MAG TPA: cytochrome c [Bryobacteraceae bacterium]|jgi:ubiquinol-cytochrome c reductase cytochrome c subunit|nr:cytochrome c [Bryobacteraceae bacterium]
MQKLLLAALLLTALVRAQDPAGNAGAGQRLYMKNGCYQCHGTVGQGTIAGARIGPPRLNAQGLIRYVRRPAGQMPAFTEKVMSDRELADVYAFLKTIPPPKPSKDIPLLNDLRGK